MRIRGSNLLRLDLLELVAKNRRLNLLELVAKTPIVFKTWNFAKGFWRLYGAGLDPDQGQCPILNLEDGEDHFTDIIARGFVPNLPDEYSTTFRLTDKSTSPDSS